MLRNLNAIECSTLISLLAFDDEEIVMIESERISSELSPAQIVAYLFQYRHLPIEAVQCCKTWIAESKK